MQKQQQQQQRRSKKTVTSIDFSRHYINQIALTSQLLGAPSDKHPLELELLALLSLPS